MLAYIAFAVLLFGIIYMLPTFIPLLFQTIKRNYGGANHELLDHLEKELLLGRVVRQPSPEEQEAAELVEMFGGVHVDKEYANILQVAQLPLIYFKDLATYAQHKEKVEAACPKCTKGVLRLDEQFDEVVVYHISASNLIPSLIQLVIQAKNDYIPHPSLNLSDSFNLDRAFVVVMFSLSEIPPELPSFIDYLNVINNMNGFRFLGVINNLSRGPDCSVLSLPRHNYHIVLDSNMDTSILYKEAMANVEIVPYAQTQILRYVMKKRKAPHVDVFDLGAASQGAVPGGIVVQAISQIPPAAYSRQYVSCDDLYKEGLALNQHMELSRAIDQLLTPKAAQANCCKEKQLIYVLGEKFEVNEVIAELGPHCATSDILIVPPRLEHLPNERAKLECRNKLCVIELWCRAAGQHLLDHTTACLHLKRGDNDYCLGRGLCTSSTCLHIYFHPTHPVALPHLAYTFRPYESICYIFKD